MKLLLTTLVTIFIILLIGSLAITLLILWSTGLSWLLIKLLPFTLFEGALLIMLATIFILYTVIKVLADPPQRATDDFPLGTAPHQKDMISEDRFWKDADEKTNEAWFRYTIANMLYAEISDLELDLTLGKAQQKELAIRLTDIVVAMLKARKYRRGARRVAITLPQLKDQMEKMGQRPYDEDILETTVAAINMHLAYDEDLVDIVVDKTWNEVDPDW